MKRQMEYAMRIFVIHYSETQPLATDERLVNKLVPQGAPFINMV